VGKSREAARGEDIREVALAGGHRRVFHRLQQPLGATAWPARLAAVLCHGDGMSSLFHAPFGTSPATCRRSIEDVGEGSRCSPPLVNFHIGRDQGGRKPGQGDWEMGQNGGGRETKTPRMTILHARATPSPPAFSTAILISGCKL
jgi:hypothetical protein